MIGALPTSLNVGGTDYQIRSDFREILNIFQAFNDPELTEQEKCYVCLKCLYVDYERIPQKHMQEAAEKAYWFVGGGNNVQEDNVQNVKTIDWEQDENIIFPAISKTAGFEIRSLPYMHWWAFVGYFGEIGEGLFSTVISIRSKLNKGKKLEKWERDFYNTHKKMIKLQEHRTAQEIADDKADEEFINNLLKAGED